MPNSEVVLEMNLPDLITLVAAMELMQNLQSEMTSEEKALQAYLRLRLATYERHARLASMK